MTRAGGRSLLLWLVATTLLTSALTTVAPSPPHALAAFPGLNGKIAFESARDGNFEIYLMNADGTDQQNITGAPGADQDPAWAPDGTRIAFARADAHFDVWVMDADGSNATNLTPGANDGNGSTGRDPAWSPDGGRIAYADGHEIWTMTPDGSDKQNLTATPATTGVESHPSWSPDGERVSYTRGGDVWVANADGSNPTQLTNTINATERGADWSPDGSTLVYESSGRIWTIEADGSGATQIASGGTDPVWSPDGGFIAFSSSGYGAQNGPDIVVMKANGSGAAALPTAPNVGDHDPSWQTHIEATDLGISISDTPDPAREGENVAYEALVTNGGSVDARLVTLYGASPFRATFESARASQGMCKKTRASISCNLGTIPAGGSATVTVVVTPTSTFDLSFGLQISASQGDSNPANNSDSEETDVLPPPGPDPVARLTWTAPDRLRDYDDDGVIDEELFNNPKGAARPFELTLNACDSAPLGSVSQYAFEVTLPSGELLTQSSANCRFAFQPPKEGKYPTTLTVTASDGRTATLEKDVPFRDYFIVSLGDSVASGEGNPDVICDQGCHAWDPPETWQDRRCHRTAKSGPSQAALALERSDPTTSVTFTHLACSGGQVTAGILYHWPGIEPPGDGSLVPPQANVMRDLMKGWGRKPDAVLVSIGANDAQFADAVTRCLAPDRCQKDADFTNAVKRRMSRLPDRYALLDRKLDDLGIPGKKVFITEYFDPTKDQKGNFTQCLPTLYPSEWQWAANEVIGKLNEHVRRAANKDRHGWHVVGGIADAFTTHGYCSSNNWVVRLEQSIDWQGDANGSFHPNIPGHILYGRRILDVLKPKL